MILYVTNSILRFYMRISRHFDLEKSQYELDFVDIDTSKDLALFLDPYFLSIRNDSWSINASRTIRSFFSHFLTLVHNDELESARELFSYLHEPNETCLGMSSGEPSGRGVGEEKADDIFNSLIQSSAITSGLVEDIEDTKIFVEGIGKDTISDITTNIIRKNLIEYTQNQCKLLGIPLTPNVPTGDFWNKTLRRWEDDYDEMLVVDGKKILLVPKSIVSFSKKYSAYYYTQHFVLNYLKNEHLRLNTALVETKRYKDGSTKKYVTKSMVRQHTDLSKEFLTTFTLQHPEVFQEFKERLENEIEEIPQKEISGDDLQVIIDFLMNKLDEIETGSENATIYHKTVTGILELVFYPYLTSPTIEQEIHQGRKRIDIVFDNASEEGFFFRLSNLYNIPCQFIHVECKNYTKDVNNPELDQLGGRFSPNRGRFGLLVCRRIDNMERFLSRCSDTYTDDRGLIIPLVDDDLKSLMRELRNGNKDYIDSFFMERYNKIALN